VTPKKVRTVDWVKPTSLNLGAGWISKLPFWDVQESVWCYSARRKLLQQETDNPQRKLSRRISERFYRRQSFSPNLMQGKGKLSLVTGETTINGSVQEPETSCSLVDVYTLTPANCWLPQSKPESKKARIKKMLIPFEALVNLENKIVLARCNLLSF
jgi:hypothetical protein